MSKVASVTLLLGILAFSGTPRVPRAGEQSRPARAAAGHQPCAAPGLGSLPVEAQAGLSAALGQDLPAYQAQAIAGGFEMRNSSRKLSAAFTPASATFQVGSASWGMAFAGYGYGDSLRPAGRVVPAAKANRVDYRRGAVAEWYKNGPLGLEQGFTVSKRPAIRRYSGTGALTIALDLAGDLAPIVDLSKTGLTLTRAGGPALRYAGLTATDADGRNLRAWLEIHDARLMIRVDDAVARYPVVVDPWVQLAQLSASGDTEYADFGFSVAISGNTVVVGAYYANVGANTQQGAAYVFVEPATGWTNMTQTAELTASDGTTDDDFGRSVAIDGNTVVVGAPFANNGSDLERGAAYVYVKPAGGWSNMTQTAKLTGSDSTYADSLGQSVGISANTIVAGAPGENNGTAYVFVMPAGGWVDATQTAELTEEDSQYADQVGSSVSISGNTIVAGVPGWNSDEGLQLGQGAADVFVKPANGWANMTETAELIASDGELGDQLGWSVAINGSTVVAGAPTATVGFNEYQGAAYVFVKPAHGWVDEYQTAKLTIAKGQPAEDAGESVAISGSAVLVGAPNATVGANQYEGVAYVFVRPKAGWTNMTQTATITLSQGVAYEAFGLSAVLLGDAVVVGAVGATVNGNPYVGAAYVFGP